jgi:protein involved in polysaccharide export with SLBB domain
MIKKLILAALILSSPAQLIAATLEAKALSTQTPSQINAPSSKQTPSTAQANFAESARLQQEAEAKIPSNVFGANLFNGNFAKNGAGQFSPDYAINSGDRVQLVMWGGIELATELVVDPQGNIFIPNVGPIQVRGIRNQDLQKTVDQAIRKVYKANVFNYVSLAAAQPVRVYVVGFVNKPGMYSGTSVDTLLYYLDMAGGIDAQRGSYLTVHIKRGNQTRTSINLYDFLLKGQLPLMQLAEGDVIFVAPRQNTITVKGLASNANVFEFGRTQISVGDLNTMAKPQAQSTHVRINRNTGTIKNTEYYPIDQASSVVLHNGDDIEYTADKKPGTISVRIEGQHISGQEYVLPYGARIKDLLKQIEFTANAEVDSLQLFRSSTKERQKELLAVALKSLESSILTARSGTSDEARLRNDEAQLMLQWIDRARNIEPSGQVVIAKSSLKDQLLLEDGDLIRVPTKDGLVLISGEVLFPSTVAFDASLRLDDYIQATGGYTQNADNSRVIIAHQDGSFSDAKRNDQITQGDKVLVLPKIDVKSRQIMKDWTQILFQIAVAAGVVLGI